MKTFFSLLLLNLLFINGIYCQAPPVSLTELSKDYKALNLKEGNTPEKWEDGMRTTGEKRTYEWWYFDAHLEDGSTMVIVFYTKSYMNFNKGLKPLVTLTIDRPDGTAFIKEYFGDPDQFSSSKDSCHVKIDNNYFKGNLKEYEIHFDDEDIKLTAKIRRTTKSWRPATGHIYFGEEKKDYFAWLVPVPKGEAEIEYTLKKSNKDVKIKGSCYHDHNWGNKNTSKLFNHWYWSRAEIGPYTLIASEMISEKEYNKENVVVFNISKDGKTLADDGSKVKMYQTYGKMHPKLHKDVSDDLIFIYDSPDDPYRYEYYLYRERSLVEIELLATAIKSKFLLCLAKLFTKFDGAYFRMIGKAKIKVYKNDQLIETHESSKAVWELMYFGKPNQK